MAKIIKSLRVKNFRGIKELQINFEHLNMFIGNNGTNKTSILEAINYAFSPAFLSGRIKSTDFYEGTNDLINIEIEFENNFEVELPDGYTTQKVACNKINLTIKKRERKSPGKVLSDLVTIEHLVIPNLQPRKDKDGNEYWAIQRKTGNEFKFGSRLLSFNMFQSEEIPRSFYFGKERDKQLTKGFNTTFTDVLDEFNWRFLKQVSNNPNNHIFNKISETERNIIELAQIDSLDFIKIFDEKIKKFQLDNIDFSFIEKSSPFNQAYFSKNYEKINLPVKYLGSGIEMIYSLLFLDTMASLSRENLIILIDEPELHLHPILQEQLANYLLELSQNEKYQIFLTTHSPIFFKTLVHKKNVKSVITKKNDDFQVIDYAQKKSIFP